MADIRFTWQALTEAIQRAPRPTTFILTRVYGRRAPEQHYVTRIVTDVTVGGRKMAPLVRPGTAGRVVERYARRLEEVQTLPEARVKTPLHVQQVWEERPPGENLFLLPGQVPPDPLDRAIAEVLENHRDFITRRHEWLAAQSLTGQVTYTSDDWAWTIDFQLPADHKPVLSGTNVWSDKNNADPIRDIRTWTNLITRKTQLSADLIIMGENAYGAFLDHPKVQSFFDKLHITPGQLQPRVPSPEGVAPITDNLLGMEVVGYIGSYVDDGGNVANYVNPDYVVVLATQAPFKLHFAAVHDADEGVTAAVEVFTKSWTEKDPSIRWILSSSIMVAVPHWPEAIVYAKVL